MKTDSEVPERKQRAVSSKSKGKGRRPNSRVAAKYLMLNGKRVRVKSGSFLDRVFDAVGCISGPEDLSTNKAYLENLGKKL